MGKNNSRRNFVPAETDSAINTNQAAFTGRPATGGAPAYVFACVLLQLFTFALFGFGLAQGEDHAGNAQQIIDRSLEAIKADFAAAPHFDCTERYQNDSGSKTFRNLMIEGSQYQELIAVNGKPLSPEKRQLESQKLQSEIAKRRSESPTQRSQRIAKYQADRKRDNDLVAELTKAFAFSLTGEDQLDGHHVYVLQATPRPGYHPINRDTEVLTAMKGKLFIDTQSFQWVKVEAQVTHPVAIEGLLARVEPGTRFELEKMAVTPDVWMAKHFSMKSHSRILFIFPHQKDEDETFWNYTPSRYSTDRNQSPSR